MPQIYTPPTEAVLSGALTLLNVHEHGGNNRGEMVELMLRDVNEPPGAPWCAAYVRRAGHYALLDPLTNRSRWPLPDTASCQALADFAAAKGILSFVPMRGDLFVLRTDTRIGFHHTGFIWSVTDTHDGYDCMTIEGNTTADGTPSPSQSTADGQVTIRTRTFPHGGTTRFIDWMRLLTEV
jgi:hypothetical protein